MNLLERSFPCASREYSNALARKLMPEPCSEANAQRQCEGARVEALY